MTDERLPEPCHCHLTDPYKNPSVIGIEISGVYDGMLFWWCEDCGRAFHRFSETDYRQSRAQPYVERWNEGDYIGSVSC